MDGQAEQWDGNNGGAQILHGNYTQQEPRHATSKRFCWQIRTRDQQVSFTDACSSCSQNIHVVILPFEKDTLEGEGVYHA
jgi:hypothetical protein